MLPNFLIIGAAKAGTNALYHYVRNHPEGFMPNPKELRFFSHEEVWSKGLDWYKRVFAPGASAKARGEGSVQYSMQPRLAEVPERIAQILPDVRLIYLVRDPIERMRSQYKHLRSIGMEAQSLEDAFTQPGPAAVEINGMVPSLYAYYSLYAYQLDHYRRRFSLEQILVVKSEDLRADRRRILRKVYSFLEIDPEWSDSVVDEEFNVAERRRLLRPFAARMRTVPGYESVVRSIPENVKRLGRRAMTREVGSDPANLEDDLRKQLEDLFRDDVRRLRDYLGPDFDGWGLA